MALVCIAPVCEGQRRHRLQPGSAAHAAERHTEDLSSSLLRSQFVSNTFQTHKKFFFFRSLCVQNKLREKAALSIWLFKWAAFYNPDFFWAKKIYIKRDFSADDGEYKLANASPCLRQCRQTCYKTVERYKKRNSEESEKRKVSLIHYIKPLLWCNNFRKKKSRKVLMPFPRKKNPEQLDSKREKSISFSL